ncbi:transcriptional regulator [Deinococcus sp. HMF7620]|uniref:Transcriptional regulator n=2 Tax=Deinococcus TaxID=1298 RepID=A0A7C9LJD9_9DEIO|nr:helix-turn-helix domain-containing protein [Deinococcus arboris]MVN85818.1 transcriptional regulator [Deinococcus arboris]
MEDSTPREPSITDVPLCGPQADDAECPVRSILERVGDKWAASVIVNLAQGPARFSTLKRQIDGISQRMLTATLRKLERDGVVDRTVYPSIPPRVDYALTPLGQTLVPTIQALVQWALSNQAEIKAARAEYDAKE